MATKCPKCHSENPDTSRFCADCGTQLSPAKGSSPLTETLKKPVQTIVQGTVFAGRYEILGKIGEGGMGEVYRALDKNLSRSIAIKILPDAFAKDKERLARFEREAKLLASLNHPNIAAIHGLEELEGRRFLVLEMAEGETLKTRLDRGPIAVDDAIEICLQIAEGLEAAHERGIIHRDLKPGNIMIAVEGKVKILDFGLAKAYLAESSAMDIATSPTITAQMTEPGVILGTAGYMSPEQARGRSVDKRADIWAFGCIVYECLTGKRAFQGDTVSDTLAQILKGEPDWALLPQNTPDAIRALLRRCLQKDPKKRLHDIADARIEIDEARSLPAGESRTTRRFPLGWVLAIGVLLFFAGLLIRPLVWKSNRGVPSTGTVASVIKLEPEYSLEGIRSEIEFNWPSRTAMAISRDGRFIVYCAVNDAATDAKPCLFMRQIDELEANPIAGTEGGIAPFLSPDDQWVGFWADGKLKKIPIDGGIALDLCEATNLFGASWGVNDRIVFADFTTDFGLSIVSASGGNPEILTKPEETREESDHRLPSWLPDARGILFTIMRQKADLNPRIALFNTKTKEWKDLLEDASDARYIPTGHLVFMRQAVLMAVPFSLSDLQITGQAVPIRSNVMQSLNSPGNTSAAGHFSISTSGSLIYAEGGIIPDWNNSLAWVDRKGNDEPACSKLWHYFRPQLSPDGRKIVYESLGTKKGIWICDTQRDVSSPFISDFVSWSPLWTPDGKNIIFGKRSSFRSAGVFSKPADGSIPTEELIISIPPQRAYTLGSISPDGTRLAFVDSGENQDICIYDFTSQSITPFRATRHNECYPSFSPDGRWLAYCTDEEGRFEVYVSPSSGPGSVIKISRAGGVEPGWSRSGKQLFYRTLSSAGDGGPITPGGLQMWAVEVQTGASFAAGIPRFLFQSTKFGTSGSLRCWDISLDDQRFLMVKREERPLKPVTEMVLVQNWFEELKRLVPTGKK